MVWGLSLREIMEKSDFCVHLAKFMLDLSPGVSTLFLGLEETNNFRLFSVSIRHSYGQIQNLGGARESFWGWGKKLNSHIKFFAIPDVPAKFGEF